jgi:hypothetical protein
MWHRLWERRQTIIAFINDEIQVAEFTVKKTQLCLEKLATGRVSGDATLAEYMESVMGKNDFKKSKVHLLLDGNAVYPKLYECGLSDEDEVRSALEYDDAFYAPYNKDDVYADFIMSGEKKQLFAVLAKREYIDVVLQSFEVNDIFVGEILFAPLEIFNIIGESSFDYVDCMADKIVVYKIRQNFVEDFSECKAQGDYESALYSAADRLDGNEMIVIGGKNEKRKLADSILKNNFSRVADVKKYANLTFGESLAEEYAENALFDAVYAAAVRLAK